jgi:hypothetical protein
MKITQATLKQIIAEELAKLTEKATETVEEDVFAPNHYCVHHGGVMHEDELKLAEAVNHTWNEELGRATHYDMKLEDGTVLENIAFEDIQVTNASLAEAHHAHVAKRDADGEKVEEDYEHLNPAGKARLDARARIRKMATDLFATADALAEVGLDDLSDKVKGGSKMLRALHQDLGAGRNLGDV